MYRRYDGRSSSSKFFQNRYDEKCSVPVEVQDFVRIMMRGDIDWNDEEEKKKRTYQVPMSVRRGKGSWVLKSIRFLLQFFSSHHQKYPLPIRFRLAYLRIS